MRIQRRTFGKLAAGAAVGIAAPAIAQNKPLTIGFSMNLTGPLAPNGKAALLASQIWEEDINAKGGLLGRPVKLVYYDDQSNPSNVPGLYTKLLDVDKVDIIASSYATNIIAPAMPIVMQHERTFFSLFGLAVNREFHYKRYFSMTPTGGPRPKESFAEGFFEVAVEQNSQAARRWRWCGADAEFPRNAMDGARNVIKRLGLKIVYDKTYPPNTADYTPVVRAVAGDQSRHLPRLLLSGRHGRHHPRQPRGRLQAQALRRRHGRPAGDRHQDAARAAAERHRGLRLLAAVGEASPSDEGREFLKKYQAKSEAAGVDLLGYYLPPFAYARMQVIAQAVTATGGTNDDKLAEYLPQDHLQDRRRRRQIQRRGRMGGPRRCWRCSSRASRATTWRSSPSPKSEVILWPTKYKTGNIVYPYNPG